MISFLLNCYFFYQFVQKDPSLWRIVFFVASGFYFVGNLIFVIFGSGKIQPWNALPGENVEMKCE